MRFEPKSREELSSLLPKGIYKAYVRTAIEKKSTKGNDMIVLELEIYDAEGRCKVVKDNLLMMQSMQWKIYDFCESADMMTEYNAGELYPESCIGKTVFAKVVQKEAEGDFPAKNEVKSYCLEPKTQGPQPAKPKGKPAVKRETVPAPPPDSDIPFSWLIALIAVGSQFPWMV